MLIVPTIMCGGAGTRLWPASRDSMPKHLLPMLGGASTFPAHAAALQGRAGVRSAGHHHLRRLALPDRRSTGRHRHGGGHHPRAEPAGFRRCGGRGRPARGDPPRRCALPDLGGGSHDQRRGGLLRGCARGRPLRGQRPDHDAGHRADRARDRLWLHRAGRRHRGHAILHAEGVQGEAGGGCRGALHRRRLPVEQRQFPVQARP